MITRDKIRASLLGIAVGDALGMPVESWDAERIAKMYPQGIREYYQPKDHKWFTGQKAGTTTDDTQLTLAVMKAITNHGYPYMPRFAEYHVKALEKTDHGWGNSTRDSVKLLQEHHKSHNIYAWSSSGSSSGVGNGVVMKIMPLVAWYASRTEEQRRHFTFNDMVVNLTRMTHATRLAATASLIHAMVLLRCFEEQFWNTERCLFDTIASVFSQIHDDQISLDHLATTSDIQGKYPDFEEQMNNVILAYQYNWSTDKIIEQIGPGSCYVFESLPFTYAFFAQMPFGLKAMFSLIEAGGDTDSNASIIGGMLGAIHGMALFDVHQSLLDGLQGKDKILQAADDFADVCGVE